MKNFGASIMDFITVQDFAPVLSTGAEIILETGAEIANLALYGVDRPKPKEKSSKRYGFRAARDRNFNGEREIEIRDKSMGNR